MPCRSLDIITGSVISAVGRVPALPREACAGYRTDAGARQSNATAPRMMSSKTMGKELRKLY